MTPISFLYLMLAITALAAGMQVGMRLRRKRSLRRLASDWKMHYNPGDPFHLASQAARRLPLPGAAEVRVTHLIYALKDNHYRYLFTSEFTQGVIHGKKRIRRVATFSDPKDRRDLIASPLILAPEGLPPLEQYKFLYDKQAGESET